MDTAFRKSTLVRLLEAENAYISRQANPFLAIYATDVFALVQNKTALYVQPWGRIAKDVE